MKLKPKNLLVLVPTDFLILNPILVKFIKIDLKTNQLAQTFPITSEFVFENIYSTYKGDKSACEDSYISYFNKRAVPFPNNEQMVYDTGEDLKLRLKDIIVKNKFRG